MDGVRRVIAEWAAPGGPTPETWSGVDGMASLLSAAGLSGAGSPQLAIVVRPVMGLIKGTVGPDFVVVCVNFEFTVTVRADLADRDRRLPAHGLGRGPVGDRPGRGAGAGAVGLAGHRGRDRGGYRDLRHV